MRAAPALALALLLVSPPAAGAGDSGSQKAWNPRKTFESGRYTIVKRDGTTIDASGPFEVKDGMAVFHILVNFREGPLTSIPVGLVDLAATERANTAPPPGSAPTTKRPPPSVPLYDTRDIASAIDTEEMRAARERIKRKREEVANAAAAPLPEAPPKTPAPPPEIDPADLELAQQGKVQRGMKGRAVVIAWGQPDKQDSLPLEGQDRDLWTYLVKGKAPMIVTLIENRVVQIQQDERLLHTASLRPPATPVPSPER